MSVPLPEPRAILFDWDNTLVDTWPVIHQALNETLRAMDAPEWSLAKVKSQVKKSMRDSFPELFGAEWIRAAEIYQAAYRAIHLEVLTPLAGAEEMLAHVARCGLFSAVVSNKRGVSLRLEMAHLGWGKYFAAAVGSEDSAQDKPHAAPVLKALEHSGLTPNASVWFVGDTIIDLECAHTTHCTPILYGEVATEGQSYQGWSFAAHVRDHAALKALIPSE
jgi:phosphoglycolate phosphatase